MSKVLWISLNAAYDSVAHAGGKTENYYQKGLKKFNDDLRVLSFALESERQKMDLDKYNIDNEIKYYPDNGSRIMKMIDIYKYTRKAIKRYKNEGYKPDIIILQWTQIAFLIKYIKRYYPNAKYIVVEEDVTFLAYKRFTDYQSNPLKKLMYKLMYVTIKHLELKSIRESDKTICSNQKDAKLLLNEGISADKATNWIPYYQDLSGTEYLGSENNILFYGAMGRPENQISAIWFIEKVMPLLKDYPVRFLVIGGGAKAELKAFESDNIKILGYVEDLEPYFSKALCLAAPLQLGAGIKVKVLECMSAGLPVVTNEIGIEGIYAENGKEYLHAETPEEYAMAIKELISGEKDRKQISEAERAFLKREFNLDANLRMFEQLINEL